MLRFERGGCGVEPTIAPWRKAGFCRVMNGNAIKSNSGAILGIRFGSLTSDTRAANPPNTPDRSFNGYNRVISRT